ncbi:phosphomannomutase/phosphoglucomutase [Campylobacter sp. RM12327]|uniref:phosphomannomutase/phosphoglucomutase n=1 Tax=Campylobacter sputorum TaxID=206 RepID=UPI000B786E50|nr:MULTISPECIES: phosphomannomutase/phosphoglucomutase [Campylobacter]ASM40047.1 phosphomannomutase/phosphoglucomutase [Campylobacter sputorum]MBE7358194.1 phosphomannomutase/phosphoglucomutase [Campylobacter sp. RM11302]MBF6669448.1 phosphomannomutase/phosphoglucomutase [Campylobacter sp. RM12327]MBF6674453.1 phosphomannomutase/phosphoglucomutase [Campylobacter sp. RM13538]MBF6676203.1 phosphomannomutase/phosphoglucomutase [Campylobacter sp. RM12321]
MIDQIFREYDIRGIFGDDLNESCVKLIGLKLGKIMQEKGVKTLSIGYDARLSRNDLFSWIVSGLKKNDIKIFDIGMAPTPVGYFSVFSEKFDANIMITGSHNPKEYNGFKITIFKDSYFGKDLQYLKSLIIEALNQNLDKDIKIDSNIEKYDILSEYINFFVKEFAHLKDFKIPFVADCANGTAGITLGEICKRLNLNSTILYEKPDGNFPNHHPDPTIQENLKDVKKYMSENNLNLGIAFDGDADRVAILTPKRDIKGDELACLFTLNMKNPRVLGEVKCSKIMFDYIDKIGKSFIGKTGHSNIKKAMKELNIDLAAEVSGHIFFKERYFGFDDAMYAMMRVLELLYLGYDLDKELDKLPRLYSTDEIKVKTSEENKFKIIEILKDKIKSGIKELPQIKELIEIDGIRVHFDEGWALVRASNTTPVLVTRFEANSKEFLEKMQKIFSLVLDDIKSSL